MSPATMEPSGRSMRRRTGLPSQPGPPNSPLRGVGGPGANVPHPRWVMLMIGSSMNA